MAHHAPLTSAALALVLCSPAAAQDAPVDETPPAPAAAPAATPAAPATPAATPAAAPVGDDGEGADDEAEGTPAPAAAPAPAPAAPAAAPAPAPAPPAPAPPAATPALEDDAAIPPADVIGPTGGEVAETALEDASDPDDVELLTVTGSRVPRSADDTPVPVDVLTGDDLRNMGVAELDQAIALIAPSFNAARQTISDGTDHLNPASLRGLGPDQVLVLVNGKRRHSTALVHVNGTFGRGTVGVDLNAIPITAIERIEILRDGASAQYGSDAIAGVINVVLKRNDGGLDAQAKTGITAEGDGENILVGLNLGAPLGDDGYVNLTGEVVFRGQANRSGVYDGDIFPGVSGTEATDAELAARGLSREDFSMQSGQAFAAGALFALNAMYPIDDYELYAFGTLSHRQGEAAGFYRLPNQEDRVVYALYPIGFLPVIAPKINDQAFALGLRGETAGFDVDLSVSYGQNTFDYDIENSVNASLGAASPTTFDAGGLGFGQTVGNLDIVRPLDLDWPFSVFAVNFGSEFRVENFSIRAGDEASYIAGPATTQDGAPKAAGAQVFPGFQPQNEVDRYRYSVAAYAGIESVFFDRISLDLTGRFESYGDFGSTVNGKAAARFEFAEGYAIRGAISTGFRAPSLHQVWFNNVSTQFIAQGDPPTLVPQQVLTANNKSPITKAFGIPDLEEETSLNISAGVTLEPIDGLTLTADGYYITIDDRVVLTSRFSAADPTVADILAPFSDLGVSQAQFFTNAVDTTTTGADIVAAYRLGLGDAGDLDLSAAFSLVRTAARSPSATCSARPPGTLTASTVVRDTLFNREEKNRLEDALPRERATLAAKYRIADADVLLRGRYYGAVTAKGVDPALDEEFAAKTLLDVELGYHLPGGLFFALGADNVLNTLPDEQSKDANRSNERFIYSRRISQIGVLGGFYYARLRWSL